jgi:subtilisin family serine protease
MRRTTILALATLGVVLASAGGTSATTATTQPLQPVIVTLRAQADVSGLTGSRAHRLREVVQRRQATAAATQKPFVALVEAWRGAGLVDSFVPLWIVNGFAVHASPGVIAALAHNPAVASVTPDDTLYAPPVGAAGTAAEPNIELVNAPAVWQRGATGQGVVVATLDTGVDATHPDLSSRWRGGANSWYDPFGQHPTTPIDRTGHGTQVMGVIVGGGASGSSVGVAPGAQWIAARIFNDAGQGSTSMTHLAFQWLLDPDHDPATPDAPQVVNNSWTVSSGCNLSFAQDIQTLRAAGILPVFAAGNYGALNASPANNPGALAVGATTLSDTIASFSSRGPSACGEPSNLFPELTAPGVGIRTTDLYGGYTTQQGTSLAAPHVSGALALLFGAYPELTTAQQEVALESGARDLGAVGPDNTFGFGRLDALAAFDAVGTPDFALDVSPSSASTTPGGAASFTVTSTAFNGFTGDVTLTASGLPAAVTSSFAPATVQGGAGSSQLTVTTPSSIAAGSYPVTITGTSAGVTRSATATLVVTPPPDFSLAIAPASATTTAGGTASYAVAVSSLYGFAGDVSLSLSGLGQTQATWTFAPVTVTGGNGSSQLVITTAASLAVGSYPFTVTATSGSLTHSVSGTLGVSPPPDFTLAVNPSSVTVAAGATASFSVSVTSLYGFAGDVSLALTGLSPTQATWSFTPATVPGGSGSSQLAVTTSSTLAPGSYPVTITGNDGGRVRTATATLVVTVPPDFGLSVSPSTRTVRRGGQTTYLVSLTQIGGFASSVSLTTTGLPSGVTGSFAPAQVSPPGTSTLTVKVGRQVKVGTYTITIRGTGGGITHTTTTKLTVTT